MASIKCGHCKQTHASVAEVKACASRGLKLDDIDFLWARNSNPVTPTFAPITEAGMYKTAEGTIYKVQKAVHGSGHLYAKRLEVSDIKDGNEELIRRDVSFVYAPGVSKALSAADRMTPEDAKAFGALYGTCCVCGRTLTNETSIEAGIGPVCGGRL